MKETKFSNEQIEKMLIEETKGITPNLLSKIKSTPLDNVIKEDYSKKSVFSFIKSFSPLELIISFVFVIALIVGVVGINVYNKPCETVTIDVNPSIELVINRFDRVIEINFNNDDANEIYNDIKFKNKKIDVALEKCYESLLENGYLDNEDSNMIIVSGYSHKDSFSDEKLGELYNVLEDENIKHNIKCSIELNKVTEEMKKFALDNNITVGKAKVIDMILDEDVFDEETFDNLVDLSMQELKKIYKSVHKEIKSSDEIEKQIIDSIYEILNSIDIDNAEFKELKDSFKIYKDSGVMPENLKAEYDELLKIFDVLNDEFNKEYFNREFSEKEIQNILMKNIEDYDLFREFEKKFEDYNPNSQKEENVEGKTDSKTEGTTNSKYTDAKLNN